MVLAGFRIWGFSLADSVLIAFITSTTVNVVGYSYLSLSGCFPVEIAFPMGRICTTEPQTYESKIRRILSPCYFGGADKSPPRLA